jgi:DnaK suppressor protein
VDKRSIERFRKLLRQRRDDLHLRLAASRPRRDRIEAKDEADRATAAVSSEMSAVENVHTEKLLRAVNYALDQIDAGTFGDCRNCGQEISRNRLEAIPWTRYCITCQEMIDSDQ